MRTWPKEGPVRARIWGVALAAAMMAALAQPVAVQATGTFEAPNIEVMEGTRASFMVKLPKKYDFTISYAFKTEDGTATGGDDYKERSGRITFAAGDLRKYIRVKTFMDEVEDDNETFKVKLSDRQTTGPQALLPGALAGVPTEKTMNATIVPVIVVEGSFGGGTAGASSGN